MRLVEHRDRLADARRGPEVDPQRASTHALILSGHPALGADEARQGEVELEDVDPRLAEEPGRSRPCGVRRDEGPHAGDVEPAGRGDALDLRGGIRRRDVRVEPAGRMP